MIHCEVVLLWMTYGMLAEESLHLCHNGVDDTFLLHQRNCDPAPTLIHVGSTIPRKCINFQRLSQVLEKIPELRLYGRRSQ